jgi:FAD/FMN-containing dehydrogenase
LIDPGRPVRTRRYQSWGRYPQVNHTTIRSILWQNEIPDLAAFKQPILPVGYGRSYGDSCLNEGGVLLDATPLRRFLDFDEKQGLLRCEAGVMLADILDVIVPRGWFLPVSPGTKFVSVGGAIANDIHGKNHHKAGTFGCHVTRFELLRSNGERLICAPDENADLFRATIGGLGLTGLITWAEFRLRAIPGPFIAREQIRFSSIDEFFDISASSDRDYEYTVAWVDCLASGKHLGRGLFMRGNHDRLRPLPGKPIKPRAQLNVPFDLPPFVLNTLTIKAFNSLLYHAQWRKRSGKVVHYDPFFYPLDSIQNWNRMYGRQGFLQYQCVVPYHDNHHAIKEILQQIGQSGEGSFLAVLKTFGNIQSPGMLSFPRPGVTLALDFAFRGESTLRLLERLDRIVRDVCGAVYPAKDARMSAESFQAYFPRWRDFARYIDPRFSSSFWRRVTAKDCTQDTSR